MPLYRRLSDPNRKTLLTTDWDKKEEGMLSGSLRNSPRPLRNYDLPGINSRIDYQPRSSGYYRSRKRRNTSCASIIIETVFAIAFILVYAHVQILPVSLGNIQVDPRITKVILELMAFIAVALLYGRVRTRRFQAQEARANRIEERLRHHPWRLPD